MGQLLSFVPDIPVFVVDDDLSVPEALLKIEGYAAQSFGDGASFLEAVRGTSPACVIPDLHLPGDSGFDILRKLAIDRVAAPILVISGGRTSQQPSRR